ncbi:MAG: hypothetical protein WC855_02500 [Thermodesulfovibrionales bacterium]
MPKKISIVTGPIVGLKSTKFIEETTVLAKSVGEKIISFNLFSEILEQNGLKPKNAYEEILHIGNLLNGYEYQFKCMREKAYLSIARKMDKLGKDVSVIIRTPASIEWRGYNFILKDHRIISEVINPDIIITLINAEWKIKKHLESNYGQHVLKVIAQKKEATISKILEWLASEVSVSEDWAEWASFIRKKKVPHIIFGLETPSFKNRKKYVRDVEGLAKLVTQKNVPTFYASYSMTVAKEGVRKKINFTIWDLRAYGVVIDPASIELGANVDEELESVVFAYTVCRDLRWDVKKVDAVVAIHPYDEMPPLSTGMMDELGHARAYGKDRYLIMPVGGGSPFTSDNYVPANHVFKNDKEFFNFIGSKRRPTLKPKFKKFQKAFGKWQSKNDGK